MAYNPFDLTGGPFLLLYILLFVVAVIASKMIGDRVRPEGRRKTIGDVDSLAILAGGSTRYAETITAKMLSERSLTMIGKDGFQAVPVESGHSPAERRVLQLPQPMNWKMIANALSTYAAQTERRLTVEGLLMDAEAKRNAQFWVILPFLMLILFGLTKLVIGVGRDHPVGFLTIFLIVTAIVGIVRLFRFDLRTQAGRDATEQARLRFGRLKRASTVAEMGLAVALFGTEAMATSAYGDFHRMRHGDPSSHSGGGGDGGCSGSSGDGGSGGGGCGGGGCGGCGS